MYIPWSKIHILLSPVVPFLVVVPLPLVHNIQPIVPY